MNVPEALAYVDQLLAQHAFAGARGWFAELGIHVPPEVTAPADVMTTLTTEQLDAVLGRDGQPPEILEAAKRERARRPHETGSLAAWVEIGPPGEEGPIVLRKWQRFLCLLLQGFSWLVILRMDPRGTLSVPAQEGKTSLILRWLIWHMASFDQSVGYGSYNQDHARDKGGVARRMVRSSQAIAVWPHLARAKKAELGADGKPLTDADDDFSVPPSRPDRPNPRFLAIGRGGGSGYTLSLFVPDDAFKDPEDYRSAPSRRIFQSWYGGVIVQRVRSRGGGVFTIGTRYGRQDAHAHVQEVSSNVVAINLPLRAGVDDPAGREPGEYISPLWTPEREADARREAGSTLSAAMYDGAPVPEGGRLWQPQFLSHTYSGDPLHIATTCERTWLALDGAQTAGGGDWSVLVWWGIRRGQRLKLGQWREQLAFTELLALCRRTHAAVKPNGFLIEKASSGVGVADTLKREIPGVIEVIAVRSKGDRYRAVLPIWESGSCLLPEPKHAPWVGPYADRLLDISGEGDEVDDEADADTLVIAHELAGAKTRPNYGAAIRALQGA